MVKRKGEEMDVQKTNECEKDCFLGKEGSDAVEHVHQKVKAEPKILSTILEHSTYDNDIIVLCFFIILIINAL